MNEHDDLASRLAGAARRPVDPMPADAVELLEQRLLAVADDDRTITPVALPPSRRRRAVLVTAAAIGTAAAAVAIAVAVTGSPDRSLTPAGSGEQQSTDPTTNAVGSVESSSSVASSVTSPTTGTSTSIAPGTSVGAVPGTGESSSSVPPTDRPSTTTASNTPTNPTRPAPTTVPVPSTAGPTTTVPAPSTTIARQPLPAPTLALSASRSGGTITLSWTRVGADGFGQYVLARVPADGISTWPSGMARVVARLRLAARGSYTVDTTPGEERSFVVIALSSDQRVIAVTNVLTVPG